MSTEDPKLVRRCLRGDSEPCSRWSPLPGRVFGLCVRLLNHRQDAEDVTQEVFLRVFRSLQGWDPTRALRPWIVGIAVNRCRTWLAQRPAGRNWSITSRTLWPGRPRTTPRNCSRRSRPPWPSCAWNIAPCSCCSTNRGSPMRRSPRRWTGRSAPSRPGCTVPGWRSWNGCDAEAWFPTRTPRGRPGRPAGEETRMNYPDCQD